MIKFLSIFSSCLECPVNIFHAISIDMNDWSIDRFSQVWGVHATSSFSWYSGETNLIIYNNVYGTSNSIVLQILHLQWFIANSLSCKWCITMDQHWNNLISSCLMRLSFSFTKWMMFSSGSTHNNWINTFEMRWICKNFNGHISSIWVCSSVRSSKMILHITRVVLPVLFVIFLWHHTLELSKHDFKRLSDHVY